MNKQQADQFKKELIALCKKHKLVAVPTYSGEPSGHDPMYIVELDFDWLEYLKDRVWPDPDWDE